VSVERVSGDAQLPVNRPRLSVPLRGAEASGNRRARTTGRLSAGDQALRTIEARSSELSPASQDRLEALVRTRTVATDGRLIARRIAATGSRDYESAYDKH
jgi:hypothetical protein